jgi:hypothetical protein
MPSTMEVTERSLSETLEALARFSGAGPGVTRIAYDAAWREAHRWLRERATALGLAAYRTPRAICSSTIRRWSRAPTRAPSSSDRTSTPWFTAGATTAHTAR